MLFVKIISMPCMLWPSRDMWNVAAARGLVVIRITLTVNVQLLILRLRALFGGWGV